MNDITSRRDEYLDKIAEHQYDRKEQWDARFKPCAYCEGSHEWDCPYQKVY
jgi:hypothetical protein